MSDTDAREVKILVLGASGGTLELIGVKYESGWSFQLRTDESTLLELLSDEDASGLETCHKSPWVREWSEVLDQLEKAYPNWRRLHPRHVEPAFRVQIVGAFLGDRHAQPDDVNTLAILRRWAIAFGLNGS